MTTCKGIKLDGEPCNQQHIGASGYCYRHEAQAPDGAPASPEPADTAPDEAGVRKIEDLTAPTEIGDTDERARVAAARRKKTRAMKTRLGGFTGQRLNAHKRSGYRRRWINDSGTRIEEMLDRGYDFVLDRDASIENDDLGTRKSLQVSKHGPPVTAYLMEIPEETVREGLLIKEQAIQETENSIRSASDGIGQSRDSAGQSVVYNPSKSGNQLLA